jgi:gamma-glutamyltranspeptidase
MKRATISLAIAIAIAASFAVTTTRVAAQDEQGGGGRRAATPPKPGAPEPIVGGIRPPIIGSSAGASAGHPLTTAAAIEILQRGGNAFDAGVAALLVGGVVEQDLYSLGGEALVLVYPVKDKHVTSVVGQGWAPKGASIEFYKANNKTLEGEGLDPSVVPGPCTRL